MKNRYTEIVFETDEGINLNFLDGKFKAEQGTAFKILESEDGALIIKALNDCTTDNIYSENYVNPPIPEGYKHVKVNGTTVLSLKNILMEASLFGFL